MTSPYASFPEIPTVLRGLRPNTCRGPPHGRERISPGCSRLPCVLDRTVTRTPDPPICVHPVGADGILMPRRNGCYGEALGGQQALNGRLAEDTDGTDEALTATTKD